MSVVYRLVDLFQQMKHPRILVLGDLILDRYVWGNAERISQEAPVILLREDRQEMRLGGAANVANMLRGLDTDVTLAGVVGADPDGQELRQTLREAGIDCSLVLEDPHRPTTLKQRLMGRAQNRHPHQMMRIDRESRAPLDESVASRLAESVVADVESCHAVLISDYAKGVCTNAVLRRVIDAAKRAGVPVIVDPGAGVDYTLYRGATALTPNRLETQRATGIDVHCADDAFSAGRRLCALAELDHVFVTLDSDGIAVIQADGEAELVPTRKREVYDITGAGDMVLAMIGIGEAEGIAPGDLARLANIAGGLEVEQVGVVALTRDQILDDLLSGVHRGGTRPPAMDYFKSHTSLCPEAERGMSNQTRYKIYPLDALAHHVEARRRLGQRIVLTNGCFDVLHIGHVSYLQQAASEGDCLIVAVNSDASVRRLEKGADRPIFPEEYRAAMLAALEVVDYVTVFDELTPHNVLETLRPDVLVKGGTYTHDEIVGWEIVEAYGGAVKALGEVAGVSTTEILQRLRGIRVRPQDTSHKEASLRRKAG